MENAQELIQRLNHSGKKLSKSHRRIAECIVTHYDKAAFMTASRLGEYVGVSESTVVRFAAAEVRADGAALRADVPCAAVRLAAVVFFFIYDGSWGPAL